MNLSEAIQMARNELHAGFISAFCVENHPDQGRRIVVQSDQGIDPRPFWCEFPPEVGDDHLLYV